MLEWIAGRLEQGGYAAIALLMFLENVFPPIPSELIMPLAGFAAARGDLELVPVVGAGAAGSLAGALVWYAVGRWIGEDRLRRWSRRHGHWAAISPRDVDTSIAWFQKHCSAAVFLGRLVPTVRTLISVPAGLAAMSPSRFLLYSALGTFLWSGALAWLGFILQADYERVSHYLSPLSTAALGLLVLWYVARVIRLRRGTG